MKGGRKCAIQRDKFATCQARPHPESATVTCKTSQPRIKMSERKKRQLHPKKPLCQSVPLSLPNEDRNWVTFKLLLRLKLSELFQG